ncbi:transmembrane protein, putative [Medicago truncatula]|uniref:Transmembrane protein, putative n=1 Tax=Medicago truncatula TaxID=3880 RepID=A0A072UVC5_MEDTR|nr:transmembrane protein, putative [Medicago truncatula]
MRSLRQYSFRKPDLLSLRKLGKKVLCTDDFFEQHGNLLGVVKTDIDEGLLNAFVQFYDPGYHCFTFQDYQILPTLEEYSCWINLPVLDKVPFSGLEETPKHSTIAATLHLETDEVKTHLITRGKFLGFSTDFLYERTTFFDKMGVAYAFNSILALLVYGLVLFPSLDNFVDIKAIQIFLSKNPVPTLLGDTYLSIHRRTQAGRGTILCCAQLLYRWITSLLPRTPHFTTNPENLLWSKRLMSLTPAEVVWYDRVYDKGTIIDSCGKFANVPLLGMEGGISYNPTLARRQFGYPMEKKPLSIYLENVYYFNTEDSTGMREQVVRAWHTIRRRDKGQLGKKTGAVHESYTQWVIDRAVQIRMPYKISRFVSAITPAPPLPMTFDTEKECQEKIAELTRESYMWERKYRKKEQEYDTLKNLLDQQIQANRQEKEENIRLRAALQKKEDFLDKVCPGRKKRRMDLFDGPHSDFED